MDFSVSNHSLVVLTLLLFFYAAGRSVLWTYRNKTVRYDVLSLCQRMFSDSYSTVLSQKYPTLLCQQYLIFFLNRFHWLALGRRVGSIWTSLQTSLIKSVPQSLSLSCASLTCNRPVYIRGRDPQSLSLHKHSGWVCPSSSIHISCRWHPWILICLL